MVALHNPICPDARGQKFQKGLRLVIDVALKANHTTEKLERPNFTPGHQPTGTEVAKHAP